MVLPLLGDPRRPIISINTGTTTFFCLIDTGATHTCFDTASITVADAIINKNFQMLQATNLDPIGTVPVFGINLNLQPENTTKTYVMNDVYACRALKKNSGVDIILGMDFLLQCKAMSFEHKSFEF